MSSPAETLPAVQASRQWTQAHGAAILAEYGRMLAIPNHASDLPNITRNAELLAELFAQRGLTTRLLTQTDAPPIVFGERRVASAERTLCFYAHYDGQPVEPALWAQDPFQATLYDGPLESGGRPIAMPPAGQPLDDNWRLYARSSADDKAPIIALLTALDALEASGLALTSNIKIFLDGEEESSSPHVAGYLDTYSDLLEDITLWLLCDGAVYATGGPVFNFGSRGVTGMQLTVYGAIRSLHSGHYGNWAPVPGMMLAHLLASMKAEDGTVLIPGFYESSVPLSDFEKEQLAAAPNIDEQLKAELGLAFTEGNGASRNERVLSPSLTIRGLLSGSVGEKTRNVIPNTAIAELGFRLVKGNEPEKMLDLVEAHIRQQGWHIVYDDPTHETRLKYPKIVKVKRDKEGFPAAKVAMDQPAIQAVIAGLKAFTGDSGVFLPATGASNRIYGMIFEGLQKPGLSITMVNRDNNQHAPNENLRLGNLWYGVDMMAVLLTL
ncbi:MAG: M20/M25/M40 family metallo-hydrolase [Anaerolineales bacterium]|nr:M20/M25/M40 family metallo-hydrolase [Anaerolineales bacterium]